MSLELTDDTSLEDLISYLQEQEFSEEIVRFILEKGFDVNILDKDRSTPLIFASSESNDSSSEETVKMLIDAGASLDIQNKNGYTALMTATNNTYGSSSEETVRMLIDAGANLNIQNNDGYTALMMASSNSNESSTEDTVRMLVDADANLNIQNKHGITALMLASINSNESSSEETVRMLINAGANMDIQNNTGLTALMLMSKNSDDPLSESIIRMLIDAGASLDIKDNKGETAYDMIKNINPSSPLLILFNTSKLLNQRIRVNITKTVRFEDPIMMSEEDINVGKYIEEDKDNIVIVYDKNRYFFTNRETIMKQEDDATLYPCIMADTMKPENIIKTKPLYDLKKIGFIAGFPCVISKVFDYPENQLFALINTDEKYNSFVSDGILNRGDDYVSGLHCQAGQESRISYMILGLPSIEDNLETVQMGGVRTLNDIKKFERKQKRTRKNKEKLTKKNKHKKTKKYSKKY